MAFVYLLVGHLWADFILQSDSMAKGKNRHREPVGVPPGQSAQTVWPYWLTSHAVIHGTLVYFISASLGLAIAETAAHWVIDFGKCENWYGIHVDQSLHGLCKLIWAGWMMA